MAPFRGWNYGLAGFDRTRVEKLRAQRRARFCNAWNHTQFASLDATARFDARGAQVNGQFGQYTSARDPRVAQLAVRLEF